MDENVLGNVVGSLINRNNQDGNCWGGGLIWVLLLVVLSGGFGGFGGWGNRMTSNVATTQDVATATAYNQIDNGIRGLERGQSNLGYNFLDQFGRTNMLVQGAGNNIERAVAESVFAAKDCCCNTNRNIDTAKYDITRNIDTQRFEAAKQTCDITAVDNANTQKILDKLCSMEINAKDATILDLSTRLAGANQTLAQGQQTDIIRDLAQQVIAALKAPAPVPAYVVANPNCNCSIGYNYNGTVIA